MATISIADNDARVQYTQAVTANTTQLTIDFPFFSLDDINVIVTSAAGVDTTLTRGTGTGTFAVTGTSVDDGFSGGHITLGDTYSDAATKYTIFRNVAISRTTDFPTSGPFNISSLNTELDKIFAIEQELETKIGRTMKLADSDTAATLSLPNLDTRKGTVLAFNTTTGLPEAGPEIGDVSTIAAITTDIGTLADIEDGTDATDAIQTVSGISGNVTTVSGISGNVTTVAGISGNVSTVAGISSDVTSVAGKASLITSDFVSDLNLITADVVSDLNTIATSAIINDMDALADIATEIDSLSDISANITTVAGISANTTTVAGISANVTTVAGISSNVTSVAGNESNITTVATNISDVTTAASSISEITSFNDIFAVSATAPSSPSNGDLWYDTTNSKLMVYVTNQFQEAGAYLQGLTSTHIFTATGSQTDFATDDDSNTMNIYTNGNTLVFLNGVRLVEGTSSTNDYYIDGNTVKLNTGATAGDTLLVEVFTKISTTQEASLNQLVTDAQGHANTASTHATTATTKAAEASTSATNASTAQTAAETAQTAAETAKTGAETAKTAAETAKTSAETALDTFDDRFLGAKSSAPTVDNDGDALLTGAIYWDTTASSLYVWDGSAWQQGAFTAGSLLANVLEDTTPQLGGDLDVVTYSIVSTTNRDINITPNGTGNVVLDGLSYPSADGTNGQFLTTDGSGNLSFGSVPAGVGGDNGVDFNDSVKARFGTGNDLEIFHNATDSIINDSGTGTLKLQQGGSTKLELTSSGIDITGDVLSDTVTLDNGSNDWKFRVVSNNLIISYGGTDKMKLDSSGNLTVVGDVTAFGTI